MHRFSLDLPSLIPREDLFGNPEKASPNISPDGSQLAYLAPDEGVLNVWLRTIGQEDDRAVTRDRNRGIRSYFWAYDKKHLLYVQDIGGDENWHVWSANPETGVIRDLTPFQGAQAQVIAVEPSFPNEILVGLNVRDARVHDVYRIDLTTGAVTMEVENPGDIVGWVADSRFKVRAAHAAMPDGGFQLRVLDATSGEWRPLITWGPDEEGQPYAFTPDGNSLYIGNSIGSNTQELRTVDLATGEEKTIASNPEVDLSEALVHPTAHNIQAVGFNKHRLEWTVLDPAIQPDFDLLRTACPGEFFVVSRDLADRTWIVLTVQDNAPAAYHTYARETGGLELLFVTRPALQNATLAEMRPVDIPARDGLTLPSYLTLPPGLEHKNLPLVLNVHGGPWARDTWGYDPEAQWIANRGYASLQVNYRGSTGFGKKFLHAADREWAGKMHDDLLDAVQWAVDQGYADPKKIAIFGGSYGGYAALVGAAFTPDVFCCSVDIVGPSSLITLINSIPPYWEPLKKLFTVRVGDPETDREFLESRSPLFKADQIECPLLIAQGANDPRVKQAESEQIVKALRDRGKEVEYILFEDEGHGFAKPENRLRFYGAAEKFLAAHLGGRAE
jgi:dipeptidyl aminopeptidase/acylaminoacyl peptidase